MEKIVLLGLILGMGMAQARPLCESVFSMNQSAISADHSVKIQNFKRNLPYLLKSVAASDHPGQVYSEQVLSSARLATGYMALDSTSSLTRKLEAYKPEDVEKLFQRFNDSQLGNETPSSKTLLDRVKGLLSRGSKTVEPKEDKEKEEMQMLQQATEDRAALNQHREELLLSLQKIKDTKHIHLDYLSLLVEINESIFVFESENPQASLKLSSILPILTGEQTSAQVRMQVLDNLEGQMEERLRVLKRQAPILAGIETVLAAKVKPAPESAPAQESHEEVVVPQPAATVEPQVVEEAPPPRQETIREEFRRVIKSGISMEKYFELFGLVHNSYQIQALKIVASDLAGNLTEAQFNDVLQVDNEWSLLALNNLVTRFGRLHSEYQKYPGTFKPIFDTFYLAQMFGPAGLIHVKDKDSYSRYQYFWEFSEGRKVTDSSWGGSWYQIANPFPGADPIELTRWITKGYKIIPSVFVDAVPSDDEDVLSKNWDDHLGSVEALINSPRDNEEYYLDLYQSTFRLWELADPQQFAKQSDRQKIIISLLEKANDIYKRNKSKEKRSKTSYSIYNLLLAATKFAQFKAPSYNDYFDDPHFWESAYKELKTLRSAFSTFTQSKVKIPNVLYEMGYAGQDRFIDAILGPLIESYKPDMNYPVKYNYLLVQFLKEKNLTTYYNKYMQDCRTQIEHILRTAENPGWLWTTFLNDSHKYKYTDVYAILTDVSKSLGKERKAAEKAERAAAKRTE